MTSLFDARAPLFDLMMRCLEFHPTRRWTAAATLEHRYFTQTRPHPPSIDVVAAELHHYPPLKAKARRAR
jgi:serine/threonine protein kinase